MAETATMGPIESAVYRALRSASGHSPADVRASLSVSDIAHAVGCARRRARHHADRLVALGLAERRQVEWRRHGDDCDDGARYRLVAQ
jgi:hypothetical protein